MSQTVIEVSHLSKQYMKKKVLDDVSFKIEKGVICGLIGPNGAGKTTIMKILGGLVLPTDGSFKLYESSPNEDLAVAHERSRMSFIIETPYAKQKMTAKENLEKIRIMRGIPNKERVDEVLKLVGLENVGRKKVEEFSLGMRQRLGIAMALLGKPEVLILDEPVNGLDPEGIVEIRELLLKLNREDHVTILISSHILSELSILCTHYMFMNHGKIIKNLSREELDHETRESYHIHTDDDARALAILQDTCRIEKYEVEDDGALRIFDGLDQIRDISKALYDEGVIPLELTPVSANLEQFYLDSLRGE